MRDPFRTGGIEAANFVRTVEHARASGCPSGPSGQRGNPVSVSTCCKAWRRSYGLRHWRKGAPNKAIRAKPFFRVGLPGTAQHFSNIIVPRRWPLRGSPIWRSV